MKILISVILITIFGCGVKEAPPTSQKPLAVSESKPFEGVLQTSEKKFLAKASRTDLEVSPTFQIVYRFVTSDLENLSDSVSLKAHYFMPEMPEMPVTPVDIKKLSPGGFQVTYDISMEGKWQILLELQEGDQTLDSLAFDFEILTTQ